MKVWGRVAMEFEVDAELFERNPETALQEALKDGRASISGGDNYLPVSWNEGVIKDDLEFGLGIHRVRVGEE